MGYLHKVCNENTRMKSMRYCSRRQCQGTPGRCVDPCTNNVETGNQHFWTSARLFLRHVKSDIFLFWYDDMKAGPRVAEAPLARRLDTRRSAPAPGITLWGTATLTFTEIFAYLGRFQGDPFVSCRPFTPEDLCRPNPCGPNAYCEFSSPKYHPIQSKRSIILSFQNKSKNLPI